MASPLPRRSAGTLAFVLLGLLAAAPGRAAAEPPAAAAAASSPLDIQAQKYEYDVNTGVATGQGRVRFNYADIQVTCDDLRVDTRTKEIAARGNVLLTRGNLTWHADELSGNLDTRQFTIGASRAHAGIIYMKAGQVQYVDKERAILRNAILTTCDHTENPHYCFTAGAVTRYPDGSFVARNIVWKIGAVPVFWLPVIWGGPDDARGGGGGVVEIKPGYSSKHGAFLLLARSFRLSKNVITTFRLDLRSKNGIAIGNETKIRAGRSQTDLLVYGMVDNDAPKTDDGWNRRFAVEQDRYRLRLYHHTPIRDDLNLRLQLDKLSDIDMLENWYSKEYRNDPQPTTFADLTWDHDRFSLSLHARGRVNDFYTETEELPSLKLTVPRQELLPGTGLYYQGESSVASLRLKWREFDLPPPPLTELHEDYDSLRLDTLHMFYLPLRLGDWQFLPRAGGRLTWYSRTSRRAITPADLDRLLAAQDPDALGYLSATGYDADGGSALRLAGEFGFELSTKFFRTWQEFRRPAWDIDGLRHVVQPYLNYTYAPEPSEERDHLYFFDEIDRLVEQNFVRLGLKQRWQTRRSNRIYTLATLENFADFHFHQEEGFDQAGYFGNLLTITPNDRLAFRGGLVVDMGDGSINRGRVGLDFGDPQVLRTELSYLYRANYAARTVHSMGSTLTDIGGDYLWSRYYEKNHFLTLDFAFPINAKTGGHVRYEYDIEGGRLARQLYELRRDLHCWMGTFGVEEEDGKLAFILAFYLKAYDGLGIETNL
ncbi:MAG: LPS assembly protein LptD [Lentisphaeria bacterium]